MISFVALLWRNLPPIVCRRIGSRAHVSLFPLLFRMQEYPLNVLGCLVYHPVVYYALKQHHGAAMLNILDRLLIFVALPMTELFCGVLHPLLLMERLPFLALLVRSVVCAVCMLYIWALSARAVHQHWLVRICPSSQ